MRIYVFHNGNRRAGAEEKRFIFSSREELEEKVLKESLYGEVFVYDREEWETWQAQPDSLFSDDIEELDRYRIWKHSVTGKIVYG